MSRCVYVYVYVMYRDYVIALPVVVIFGIYSTILTLGTLSRKERPLALQRSFDLTPCGVVVPATSISLQATCSRLGEYDTREPSEAQFSDCL